MLIINNGLKYSDGNTDVLKLQTTFTNLGFKVFIEEDLTDQETKEVVVVFAQDPKHEKVNCVALVVIAEDKAINFKQDICPAFDNDICSHIRGKPKLFFMVSNR